jgi:hypothetical protein
MTGSQRAKQRRADRLLAFAIRNHAVDLAFCAACPCDGAGSITREQVVAMLKCTPFEAERAFRVLQRHAFLDMSEEGTTVGHQGRWRWPVLDFRGCRTSNEARTRIADQRSLSEQGSDS